jgi:predicted nuclease of predicted toxin-antitoxin system
MPSFRRPWPSGSWRNGLTSKPCLSGIYLGLRNAEDREIFAQAKSAGAVVMTKDRDFLALLFMHGPPPQVIWLRVGNSSNMALQSVLLRTLDQAIASLREGEPWVEIRSSV